MVSIGHHLQMAELFRLVNYYNLPRYIYIYSIIVIYNNHNNDNDDDHNDDNNNNV